MSPLVTKGETAARTRNIPFMVGQYTVDTDTHVRANHAMHVLRVDYGADVMRVARELHMDDDRRFAWHAIRPDHRNCTHGQPQENFVTFHVYERTGKRRRAQCWELLSFLLHGLGFAAQVRLCYATYKQYNAG